jgi:hypothetical protein
MLYYYQLIMYQVRYSTLHGNHSWCNREESQSITTIVPYCLYDLFSTPVSLQYKYLPLECGILTAIYRLLNWSQVYVLHNLPPNYILWRRLTLWLTFWECAHTMGAIMEIRTHTHTHILNVNCPDHRSLQQFIICKYIICTLYARLSWSMRLHTQIMLRFSHMYSFHATPNSAPNI